MNKIFIEDCCEILDSMRVPITASKREIGEYPYYGANGIQDYVADYIFDDELVLLAEDGGNFGSKERPIAYRVSGKCWVNNHAHVLKPKVGLDIDYLCYSLMFYKVDGLINGATRKKLTQAAMRKMQIPFRSIKEQIHIVNELNRIIKIKEKRQEELKLLDNLIKARFVEMFGDPVANEMGWDTLPLENACKAIVDCPHSTPSYTKEDTGFRCIRTSIVKKNRILWDEIEYIPEDEYVKRIQRKKPDVGDIVYTREGAILGIAAIIDRNCNVALGQRSMLLSPNIDKCASEFLCVAMNSDSFLDNALKGVSGSASPHINVGDIKAFRMIMPPIELQNQFVDFVHQVDKSKVAVQKALDETQILFDSLMQKYFG
ncbi:restriction endonuclease subunit S [Dorea longicatena]|uniref:EcoKI restriction-modification system protein HsdS n=1 Tax=Dorea longicatena TaxID=88431 RepID=A0A173WQR2_9FIRM|nr:restriction endonuclease subunit S [Dorea longicatena]CUN40685.1 EcoKI restriction-modification system protein HsdS [Dorea longicatena]